MKEGKGMQIIPQAVQIELPVLATAYLGDAVYELYVRGYLLKKGYRKVRRLHEQATSMVCASRQAEFLRKIEDRLTAEEKEIAKRGRNAKSGHAPKNIDIREYRMSTGFETLLGYLFLREQEDRIEELMGYVIEIWEKDNMNT